MMAGAKPIKAKKAQYYADPRFAGRILPPPTNDGIKGGKPPEDDWSGSPPIKPLPSSGGNGAIKADPANGGVRREPELPLHVDIAPEPTPNANEFNFNDKDSADSDAVRAQRLRARMQGNARQASLDPGDGIDL